MGRALFLFVAFSLPVYAALSSSAARPPSPVQVSFDDAMRDLASEKTDVRLSAARMLKAAAYPEAAMPLAADVPDPGDDVQIEAVAAELNIFFAEKVVVRKRVGLIVEVRNQIAAEAAFVQG